MGKSGDVEGAFGAGVAGFFSLLLGGVCLCGMSVTGLTRGLGSGLLIAVERLNCLLGSSLLITLGRLDDLVGSALLIALGRLDEERPLSCCIAGPAAGNSSVLLLFDATAGPATGSASWASNRCAGKQLKVVTTTKAVVESIIFIFYKTFALLIYLSADSWNSKLNQSDLYTDYRELGLKSLQDKSSLPSNLS
ncbi:MAG: hypothetical protein RMX96_14820 [Nostoc sp. ChiSLP02]|nr:hypothetical protein [Nostoc sp. DedSLP05]MDZ8099632.1 hypothetical protein [Nostoc sp. DedSLP01]MDZ8186112.1 hypothetical protein [Nostoc sp. ChiSLP02]